LWRGFYPGILFDDGLLHGFGLLLEEVGGVLVLGQHLAHQLGGRVPADQPQADVLLGGAPVRHFVQLPVQVISEAMGVHSLLAARDGWLSWWEYSQCSFVQALLGYFS